MIKVWRNRIRYAKSLKPLKNYKGITPEHYTYRVTWSAEDGEFVGLCAEFPLLSWLASSQEDAFSGIRQLVADIVEDMEANNERPLSRWRTAPTAASSWCACRRRPIARLPYGPRRKA